MSVQFGRWNFDGKPVDRDYLEKAKASIAPYGPDDAGSYSKNNVNILYHAFHTTKESRREMQPHVTESGAILTWDGRLDNRADLVRQLRDVLTIGSTDVEIVAAAYEYWRNDCFAMLLGDWALSIWDSYTRSLILAKDPIGTRHLYYSFDDKQVTWSTILDPLVLFAGKTFTLCEEYIAGWFSFFPAAHLTPYVGIHSVPPSSSVLLRPGKHIVRKYWDFDPGKRIRYRTDAEYEEHFCAVFRETVRRRLRSDSPVLAELSGGMDSSSIVCMADTIISRGAAETPRLDTLSYYDDCEPNWNERPYFAKVEEKRGRPGHHIDVSCHEPAKFDLDANHFTATPGSGGRTSKTARQFIDCITSQANRVVLSGIGGDESLGGVPTPIPELADLLARAQFHTLAKQLVAWALAKRRPVLHLLSETVRNFLPIPLVNVPKHKRRAPWLKPDFSKRNRSALRGYECRIQLLGPLPSFQTNLGALDGLRRQLACAPLPCDPCYEKRYPYLDRDFLAYLFAIPREQLVRPGQRRSLMRRALAGVTPEEILHRKRKAYVIRHPLSTIASTWPDIELLLQSSISSACGWIDVVQLRNTLEDVKRGRILQVTPVLRTLGVELWLHRLTNSGLLMKDHSDPTHLTKEGRSAGTARIFVGSVTGAGIQPQRVECT